MKKINKTPLAAAMGAAFISTLAAGTVNAEVNPFGMTELSSGYMQVAAEGTKAGEMKCGANMGGMAMPKTGEGACARYGESAVKGLRAGSGGISASRYRGEPSYGGRSAVRVIGVACQRKCA